MLREIDTPLGPCKRERCNPQKYRGRMKFEANNLLKRIRYIKGEIKIPKWGKRICPNKEKDVQMPKVPKF